MFIIRKFWKTSKERKCFANKNKNEEIFKLEISKLFLKLEDV